MIGPVILRSQAPGRQVRIAAGAHRARVILSVAVFPAERRISIFASLWEREIPRPADENAGTWGWRSTVSGRQHSAVSSWA